MLDTSARLLPTNFPPIRRSALETLQVNLGYRCNQSCVHCHVDAGPKRTENMTAETVAEVIGFLRRHPIKRLDLTGGAPELNPHFRELVSTAHSLGVQVMDRCNLTILSEPGQQGLADFLAAQRVEVIASLPCYLEENVNRQRGKGVFDASIRGLRLLNALGYGMAGSGLLLNLVFNPQGPVLPPAQCGLEADYKRYLADNYGVQFNQLFTLANMPIRRFGSMLASKGQFDAYLDTLKQAHQDDNLDGVMCRSLISLDWQGHVYDCDFNQMLDMPLVLHDRPRPHIRDLDPAALPGCAIRIAEHCYGCTAGQGSSCGGALT